MWLAYEMIGKLKADHVGIGILKVNDDQLLVFIIR